MRVHRVSPGIRAGALITATLVVAGCSFGTDAQARPVDDAPSELFEPLTTQTSVEEPEEEGFDMTLMFVDSNSNLVPVVRTQDTPPTAQNILDGLSSDPLADEQAARPESTIITRLFLSMNPQASSVDEGVLEVSIVGDELRAELIEGNDRVALIYAQIVCSVTKLEDPTITAVRLVDAEGTVPAVTRLPERVDRPVGPADYFDCITVDDVAAAAAAQAEQDDDTTTTTE